MPRIKTVAKNGKRHSSKDRAKRWRESLKSDPTKQQIYEKHKEKNQAKSRNYRKKQALLRLGDKSLDKEFKLKNNMRKRRERQSKFQKSDAGISCKEQERQGRGTDIPRIKIVANSGKSYSNKERAKRWRESLKSDPTKQQIYEKQKEKNQVKSRNYRKKQAMLRLGDKSLDKEFKLRNNIRKRRERQNKLQNLDAGISS